MSTETKEQEKTSTAQPPAETGQSPTPSTPATLPSKPPVTPPPPAVKPQVQQQVQQQHQPAKNPMLQCSCIVRLSKDHEVPRTGVTPIEAMLLVAEHHRNVGGSPIEVASITDKTNVPDTRTQDQELDRLRAKYGVAKVKALMSEVREFPTTYEAAIERGVKISLPSGAISTTKLA